MWSNGLVPDTVDAEFGEFVTDAGPETVGEGCLGFGFLFGGQSADWTMSTSVFGGVDRAVNIVISKTLNTNLVKVDMYIET